jgi:hypothetical protein
MVDPQPRSPQRDVADAVIAALQQHSAQDEYCLIVTARDHPEIHTSLLPQVLDLLRRWSPTGHEGEWPASVIGYRVQARRAEMPGKLAGTGDDD